MKPCARNILRTNSSYYLAVLSVLCEGKGLYSNLIFKRKYAFTNLQRNSCDCNFEVLDYHKSQHGKKLQLHEFETAGSWPEIPLPNITSGQNLKITYTKMMMQQYEEDDNKEAAVIWEIKQFHYQIEIQCEKPSHFPLPIQSHLWAPRLPIPNVEARPFNPPLSSLPIVRLPLPAVLPPQTAEDSDALRILLHYSIFILES
ncbi:Hypothetical predicted protein [Olea europaea subsp. europaea]|uniref:Uncharacterized protein n=1 Tax=Olea europaea subsp. europaea TaxID=158383 RepID=A0A8S0U8W4_OLEEU|nr:Hypothetical predicted protein [Olea europaea subsp. europaea]